MIQVKDVSFARENPILEQINLELKAGQILGLVGPSGAGKSTLLKIIAGLLDADSGTVLLKKKPVVGPSKRLVPGHPEIQLVNQDFALDIYHTVAENLRVKANYLPNSACEELVAELLELLDLTNLQHQQAISLSGGEQQRLALGRALAMEPAVILLDEPFAHLDVHLKDRIATYLLALKKVRKTAFILVSHDGQEVLSLADQIAFFYAGKIQRIDTPENFYYQPNSIFEGSFFGTLNVCKLDKKTIFFRPNEYRIASTDESDALAVRFQKSRFSGPYYQNYFRVGKSQTIVLFHSESLNHVEKIAIVRKNT
jgi:ABC-type sulfate/molybdate transport systems ATPase subunit